MVRDTKNWRWYQVYGLILKSEICFDQLLETEQRIEDVVISFGKVPDNIRNAEIKYQHIQLSEKEMLLSVRGAGKFYVSEGCIILVELWERGDVECIEDIEQKHVLQMYLLGSCLGKILIDRKRFPMHGSCVEKDGSCILLTGHSGAGKSTAAAAFLKHGYRLMTDDVAPVLFQDRIAILPGFPGQKLWEDALRRMNLEGHKSRILRNENSQSKYAVDTGYAFCGQPAILKKVVVLVPYDGAEVQAKKLEGITKVDILMRNVYRREYYFTNAMKQECLQACIYIAQQADMYEVVRPRGQASEDEIFTLIMESI